MTRTAMISDMVDQACLGNTLPLAALLRLAACVNKIPADRLVAIAHRRFGIPPLAAWGAIYDLAPYLIQ